MQSALSLNTVSSSSALARSPGQEYGREKKKRVVKERKRVQSTVVKTHAKARRGGGGGRSQATSANDIGQIPVTLEV